MSNATVKSNNPTTTGGVNMSEYQKQKLSKPLIGDLINENLKDSIKEVSENFILFLRDNKMSPQWGAKNSYNISYKSRRVCILKINKDSFELRINTQYNDDFNDFFSDRNEQMKSFLLDNVTYCFRCGNCKPGLDISILGKDLKNACFNPVIRIENPDEMLLDLAKKLVMLRRKAIAEGKAPEVTYIAMNKRI